MSWPTLLGALVISFAFGSLHAFGALLEPLQSALGADRGGVSLGYSLAIGWLTAGVFLSHRLQSWPSGRRALLFGLGGAGGLALAASGFGLLPFLVGYGILFGLGNGLAYALFLERAAAAAPRSPGLAIGAATATYGLGAMAAAQVMAPVAARGGALACLWALAAAIAAAAAAAAVLFSRGSPDPHATTKDIGRASDAPRMPIRLWLVYFLGAIGGLMVIAHAMAIASERGAARALAESAPALNALGNVAGSILGGLHADRAAPRRALALPLLATAGALWALLLPLSGGAAVLLLAVCGFGYGALIAAVPVVLRRTLGGGARQRTFGRVFTAWGVAGLTGPVLAGALHDLQGNYRLAILLAALSAAAACWLGARVSTKAISGR